LIKSSATVSDEEPEKKNEKKSEEKNRIKMKTMGKNN
jgi:hypothetical protein